MRDRSQRIIQSTLRKPLLLLVSVIFLFTLAAGVTLSYLLDTSSEVVNTFTPAEVNVGINETFSNENNTKSKVSFRNTSNGTQGVDAYIRAKIVITWQDVNGNVAGVSPVEGTDYRISMTDNYTGNWIVDSEGIYYHKAAVAPQSDTSELISEIVQLQSKNGYNLHVEILAEAIQAEGTNTDGTPAVELAWTDVEVDSSGKLSFKSLNNN